MIVLESGVELIQDGKYQTRAGAERSPSWHVVTVEK